MLLQIPSYLPFLIHGTSAGVFAYAARCCLLSPSARIPFRVCITPESLPNPTCADGGLELCERKEVLEWRYFPSIQSIALATVTPSLLPSPKRSSVSTILFATNRVHSAVVTVRARECARPICWQPHLDIQFLFRKICMFPSQQQNHFKLYRFSRRESDIRES